MTTQNEATQPTEPKVDTKNIDFELAKTMFDNKELNSFKKEMEKLIAKFHKNRKETSEEKKERLLNAASKFLFKEKMTFVLKLEDKGKIYLECINAPKDIKVLQDAAKASRSSKYKSRKTNYKKKTMNKTETSLRPKRKIQKRTKKMSRSSSS